MLSVHLRINTQLLDVRYVVLKIVVGTFENQSPITCYATEHKESKLNIVRNGSKYYTFATTQKEVSNIEKVDAFWLVANGF